MHNKKNNSNNNSFISNNNNGNTKNNGFIKNNDNSSTSNNSDLRGEGCVYLSMMFGKKICGIDHSCESTIFVLVLLLESDVLWPLWDRTQSNL